MNQVPESWQENSFRALHVLRYPWHPKHRYFCVPSYINKRLFFDFSEVFVNESVNNEIPEKKVCLGVYNPKHTFFSGVHTTVDQNIFVKKTPGFQNPAFFKGTIMVFAPCKISWADCRVPSLTSPSIRASSVRRLFPSRDSTRVEVRPSCMVFWTR